MKKYQRSRAAAHFPDRIAGSRSGTGKSWGTGEMKQAENLGSKDIRNLRGLQNSDIRSVIEVWPKSG
jgi:hypothetical protein